MFVVVRTAQCRSFSVAICICLLLYGCASSASLHGQATSSSFHTHIVYLRHSVSLNNTTLIKSRLYAQLKEWRGVLYREGGLSKRGVDCSGFVYLTFQQRLGIRIPRTTELLQETGHEISRKQLRAGDLVFFTTGISKHHVGVFVENGKFIHASTSRGVMLSDMNSKYWRKHYWMSKRLDV